MTNTLKIAAVVVTYNRLEFLKECIESLRNQTRKIDEIFVINNSSTDGTEEWLLKQEDLTTITQPNSGGAGGFYTGIKTAYEKEYDWIWVMDDDGLPNLNALEELVKHIDDNVEVLNSLVVAKANNNILTFGLGDYVTKEFHKTVLQAKKNKYIFGANFFNGTFISRETISKIGFPQPLFFIYGDETEYLLRIKYFGLSIKTIPKSIILHPLHKHIFVGKGKFFYRINFFNKLGVQFFPRNIIIIYSLYNEFTFRRLIKTYLYDLIGLLFIQKKYSFFLRYIYSIFSGIIILLTRKKRQYDFK